MTARIDPAEATRFLRALVVVSSATFVDDITRRIQTWATESAKGIIDARETGYLLGVWGGGLANRVERGLERPSRAFLQALWFVVGFHRDRDLRADLTPLAKAWLDATSDAERNAAQATLLIWYRQNYGAIASAMVGPFTGLGHPI